MVQKTITDNHLQINDEGYLENPDDWTEEIAEEFANELGITLTEKHFEVLYFLREQHASGVPLTIRKVGKSGIIDIKGLYKLFPGKPLKYSSKIAGIPKPASCV